jgi:hypothetical protein
MKFEDFLNELRSLLGENITNINNSVKSTIANSATALNGLKPFIVRDSDFEIFNITANYIWVNKWRQRVYLAQLSLISPATIANIIIRINGKPITVNNGIETAFALANPYTFNGSNKDEYIEIGANQTIEIDITNQAAGVSVDVAMLVIVPLEEV